MISRLQSAAGAPSDDTATRGIADGLSGAALPPVQVDSSGEQRLNLCQFAGGYPLVIYVYPGCEWSPEDGPETPLMDAMQHRAFRDHQPDLETRGYRALGISSDPVKKQNRARIENRVAHGLFSDPSLQLAARLGLPTFPAHGTCWYRRLTLVIHEGIVVKAFFPVSSAARSAAQVIAWMKIQGMS